MKNKLKNKRIAIYIALFIVLLGGSFIIYQVIKADNNTASFSTITLNRIETGADYTSFDYDGHDYSAENSIEYSSKSIVAGYEGKDANSDNSLVRSFDKISYHFNYVLFDANGNEYYDNSALTVRVRIIFDGSISNFVTINDGNCQRESDSVYSCTFAGKELLDNSGSYEDVVNVQVLNAEIGTYIDPRFEVSIDNSVNGAVVLGYNGAADDPSTDYDDSHFYEFNNGTYDNLFRNVNPMPTVVTAAEGTYSLIVYNPPQTQLANLEGETGRIITYYVAIKPNTSNGIVGYNFNLNNIDMQVTFTQDNNRAISYPNWIRLYDNQEIDGINPLEVGLPYSTPSIGDVNRYIKNPGNLAVSGSGNSFNLTLSGFIVGLDNPTLAANGDGLDLNSPYLATIAVSNFSGRTVADGQSDIVNTITITNGDNSVSTSMLNTYEISGTDSTGTANNKDYSLSTSFYDKTGKEPLSIRLGGTGAVSKGTETLFRTIFNYHKANSNQGLKEVFKFDTNAFRVIPLGISDQVDIQVMCGDSPCDGISKDDFEVKFVTGDFNPGNYTINTNYDNLRLTNSEKEIASQECPAIDLYSLSSDQVQNLYGSPCLNANLGLETTYTDLYEAVTDDNEEIPITKVIVQTKSGVNLPDDCRVIVGVGVRVRNVSDITHNYQATVVTSTSDYDNELIYYIPRGDLYAPKITDPNNYLKSIYQYRNVAYSLDYIGDDLKIVNFASRQDLTVSNTNSDGTTKINYRTTDNDTIEYVLTTNITDNAMNAGADDAWFITSLRVGVLIPKDLVYIPDADLGTPEEYVQSDGSVLLVYTLPYTKPNMPIPLIKFKAKLDPRLKGDTKTITVNTVCSAININGEEDTSMIGATGTSFSIYGTGVSEVIGEMRVGEAGTVVEKDTEFSYIISAYNNTGEDVDDYSFIDVLPYNDKDEANNEGRGSNFAGSYEVKIYAPNVPASKIKCSKADPNTISKHVNDKDNDDNNIWEDCGSALTEYTSGITAFKVDKLTVLNEGYIDDIIVYVRPTGNNYSNKYSNNFIGKTKKTSENISNTIIVSVVNRNISGRVFIDNSGMGVQDESSTYLENIPVTLYKVKSDGGLQNIAETSTDAEGKYKFENLDVGRYKLRSKYNASVYDLTLRYATEDRSKDSDAYKVDNDGTIEISDKSETSRGISLTRTVTSQPNMDIGLLPRTTFGFEMKKYITRIELNNNGVPSINTYNNESIVNLSVQRPSTFSAKVYYGISLTNNSSIAGMINLVEEDIPEGMIFDQTLEENQDWFVIDKNLLQTEALKDIIIKPGETKYLQLVLYVPERDKAGVFINNASVIDMKAYDPQLSPDQAYTNNYDYNVGDPVSFAGVNWHVVRNNNGIITLLADSGSISTKLPHDATPYKWSNSYINNAINTEWLTYTNINASILVDDIMCDDASGLPGGSYGGIPDTMNPYGCVSGAYSLSKVRLLSREEFDYVKSLNLVDYSWLYGNRDYWLTNAIDSDLSHNEYGVNTNADVTNLAGYVNHTTGMVGTKISTSELEVRPVIEISTYNIIPE